MCDSDFVLYEEKAFVEVCLRSELQMRKATVSISNWDQDDVDLQAFIFCSILVRKDSFYWHIIYLLWYLGTYIHSFVYYMFEVECEVGVLTMQKTKKKEKKKEKESQMNKRSCTSSA